MDRRLSAILAADLVGYSRLMSADESGTFSRLTELRQIVLEPLVAKHSGRIFKLMGDGLLVEFASVVNAVACALAWQEKVAAHQSAVDSNGRLQFRIGINLGDVIVEGDDVHGDGVIIAARLEGLADAGGICLSGDAHRIVRNKIGAEFEDLGVQTLKNIAAPVRIYRVAGTGSSAGQAPQPRQPSPPSDRPSVAVMPFTNRSGDPEQDYFADGLTESIINGLTRFREILVIGAMSAAIVRDQAVNLREIGRVLGVVNIVEGNVRKVGGRVRVTAQLIDAATGQQRWSESYDRTLGDIFAMQDEITDVVVATLAGQIEHLELSRVTKKPAGDLAAYDCLLKGRQCLGLYTREGELEARRHFERALELDPECAAALAGLSISFTHEYESNWCLAPAETLERAYALAQNAVALDVADSPAHYAISSACYYRGEYELANVHIEKALELNPNDYHNICNKGYILAFSNRPSESIACSIEAMRLNPLTPDSCLFAIGIAEYVAERYEEALAAFGRAGGWGLLRKAAIAACYAQLGRDTQARAAAAEVRALAPGDLSAPEEDNDERWRVYWARLMPFEDPSNQARFLEGLRKAGLPA